MKTLFSSFLFLFLTLSLTKGQNFESLFGSQSTQWNITIGNLGFDGTALHTVSGDTIIQGQTYKVIDGYGIQGFQGFLREDTLLGKAWYRNSLDTAESLIMDLMLELGDSIYIGGNWNPNPGYYKVDSIYTQNNRKHLRFDFEIFFNPGSKFTLIEGISSNLGFRYQDDEFINNFNPLLLCSYKNEVQEFGTGQCIISSLIPSDDEQELHIYPNPFSQDLKISIKNENIHEYQILDPLGRLITKELIEEELIHITNFSTKAKGLYVIIFLNKTGQVMETKKVQRL
ncbi:MAG: T9SS type A sorting domain-containing protein [Bacteroidia bacterium]|nr:T9SS type A sorting domain-containing protein [Bacteroidia bacterium]